MGVLLVLTADPAGGVECGLFARAGQTHCSSSRILFFFFFAISPQDSVVRDSTC
jgi:hypothetical protein